MQAKARNRLGSPGNRKHGMCYSEVYNVWNAMKRRCHSPNSDSYHRYGALGVTVCERWRNDIAAFAADMGPRPGPDWSIDRIDSDKGYEPGNCRWATPKMQSANRRVNYKIAHEGEELSIAELARRVGISRYVLRERAFKRGGGRRTFVSAELL